MDSLRTDLGRPQRTGAQPSATPKPPPVSARWSPRRGSGCRRSCGPRRPPA